MYTWMVDTGTEIAAVQADKVIVSDAGVLLFFDGIKDGNLLVMAFKQWESCSLDG